MPVARTILILVFSLMLPAAGWCQAQLAQVQGYVGTAIFPKDKGYELMAGYNPGVTIGAGMSKTIKHALVFNPNLEFTFASKEYYKFSLLSAHNNLKYYPFLFSKVRPYLMAIVNISFINLHQEAYQTTENPDPSYSVSSSSDIPVDQIIYREPEVKLNFAPTFGLGAGIGVDIPVRLTVVPFIQYSYTAYSSKSSSLINDNFPNNSNTTALSTQNIVFGIRYNLYESLKK